MAEWSPRRPGGSRSGWSWTRSRPAGPRRRGSVPGARRTAACRTFSIPWTRTVRIRPKSSWSKQSWTAASRVASTEASSADRLRWRTTSQTRTPSEARKSVVVPGDRPAPGGPGRRSGRGSRSDVVELGGEALADVVDLAGEEVHDRAGPLGGERRLAEPVELPVDLAAERGGHLLARRGDRRSPGPETIERAKKTPRPRPAGRQRPQVVPEGRHPEQGVTGARTGPPPDAPGSGCSRSLATIG